MTDADKTEFSDSITKLAVALSQVPSKPMLQAYWDFLRDLELSDFRRAVTEAGRESRFFPKASELRDLAGRSRVADIANAWEAVRTAMDRYDYTHSVDFGPLANAVVRNLGGWQALCAKSIPELTWIRKDFERVYEAFVSTETSALRGEPLRGAFGGTPIRVAIAGVLPPLQLEARQNGVSAVVRQLAEAKSS